MLNVWDRHLMCIKKIELKAIFSFHSLENMVQNVMTALKDFIQRLASINEKCFFIIVVKNFLWAKIFHILLYLS